MNRKRLFSLAVVAVVAVVAATVSVAGAAPGTETGPSSSQSPYLLPAASGVVTRSILTVGDSVNTKPDGITPYRMVGIPDGLGVLQRGVWQRVCRAAVHGRGGGRYRRAAVRACGGDRGQLRAHAVAGQHVV